MSTRRDVTAEEPPSVRARPVAVALSIAACCMIPLPGHADPRVTPNDPLPTKVLTCGGSIIAAIGSRLPDDPGMTTGYVVSFKNGGETEGEVTPESVLDSKVGDHVLICLVNVPKDCPSQYSYKRVYTVTNLRTLHSWSDGNSAHDYCGAPGADSHGHG